MEGPGKRVKGGRSRRALLGLLLVGALTAGATPAAAGGKGIGQMASSDGVTVPGSPYRYESVSPGIPQKLTVVTRIERDGGRISRWWYLRGKYHVPAVTYDPSSGGGLSADGRTLVLSHLSRTYPPRFSRFAIVDTERALEWHGPGRPPRFRQMARFIALRGDYSFDSISPDGSTAYLTQRLRRNKGPAYILDHELRALDLESGELRPRPVVDRSAPRDRVEGLPIARATSPDGRWAYTLYDGNAPAEEGGVPFLSALDTVTGRVASVDLPRLGPPSGLFALRLWIEDGGRTLALRRTPVDPDEQPRLRLDTRAVQAGAEIGEAASDPAPQPWGWPGPDPDALAAWLSARPPRGGLLAFARAPRRPGNLLARRDVVGRSADGSPIGLLQRGDPSIGGEVLVFGCIHGDECAASEIEPLAGGCPDPASDVYLVRNLNPDGHAAGTRLNGRGVDLNRNFPAGWRPIGERGDPEYSGPRPFSEPETRLAARIVDRLRPEVTIWFHQHWARRPLVRAFGGSVPEARRFAALARMPFRVMPWPAGTGPHWQNERFPGTSAFVVELPRGPLSTAMRDRLGRAVIRLARKVGED